MGSLVSGSVQQPLPWTQLVKYPLCLEPLFKIRIAKRWNFKWRSWRLRIHRCKKNRFACIYYIYTYCTQRIFFHHHRGFLSVDPSLKILGNVTVIDSDCRNFTRRSQSCKIDPKFWRNTIPCPWQYVFAGDDSLVAAIGCIYPDH